MAGFLAGVGQGASGATAAGTANAGGALAGASGLDSTLAIPTTTSLGGYGAGAAPAFAPTGGALLGSQVGGGLGGFGRGYLGFNPAQGAAPGFNAPSIGYGLGQLAQGGGGGGQQMNPQAIMGLLRQLLPQQTGPATRILPQGPGQAQSRGLIQQLLAGI